MSTKSTIWHGSNFHFYTEGFDDDNVFLELRNVDFEVSPAEVTVPIPIAVWEVIREYSSMTFELVDATDEQLLFIVERAVEERMFNYVQAEEKRKGLMALAGAFVFGTADAPREEQVERGLEHYKRIRDHQQAVSREINEIRQLNNR